MGASHEPQSEDVGMSWRDDAACNNLPGDIFFSEAGPIYASTKKVCAGCTVRVECLDFADKNQINYGVWGGKTPLERGRKSR